MSWEPRQLLRTLSKSYKTKLRTFRSKMTTSSVNGLPRKPLLSPSMTRLEMKRFKLSVDCLKLSSLLVNATEKSKR